ncbi:unnamed protein product [Symbiodinium sp. CCMP2592]|nr:unnamed protein product [Symbiodinium sp. CCMP2592]
MEAHSRTLAFLMNESLSLKQEIESTGEQLSTDMRQQFAIVREQLSAVQIKAETAMMGPQQWQAQVEAHIVTIQNNLEAGLRKASSENETLRSRVGVLEQANQEREREWQTFRQEHRASADQKGCDSTEVRTQVDELCATMTDHGQRLDVISRDVADLHASVAEVESSVSHLEGHSATIREEIRGLHQICEHFAVYTDEEPVVGDPGMEDYEAGWWGQHNDVDAMPQGPPPGFGDQPASTPAPTGDHTDPAQNVPQDQVITEVARASITVGGSYFRMLADDRHKQRLAGLHQLDPPPRVPQEDSESENRLVLLLIRCVPAELKQNVLEKGDESEPMRAIALLEGVLETLQPGGAAEMQSLQAFVRNLRPVGTAKEGLSVLRRWRLARSRAIALALPQVAPFEELGALGTLAQTLEKRHDRLRTMLSLLRTRPEIIRPTPEGVDMMISLLDQQFQLLHADEQVKTSRGRGQEDDLDPTAKKGKGKDGKGKGKGSKGTGKDSGSKDVKQECIEPGPVDLSSEGEESPEPSEPAPSEEESEGVESIPEAGGPLWVLDLSLRDYIHWTRPSQIQVCADRDFREEENPNSIVWAVWDTIIHDELDVDETGTIPIAERVCMIKCDTTVVLCEDGVGRPCFVVWIQEESSGRERQLALARIQHRPRVRRWPEIPDPHAAPARAPDAASAYVRGAPPAKASSTGRCEEERCVLADTGANELIRPVGPQPPARSSQVRLTLADGNTTCAWRTRDGELAMPGDETSWIVPVGRLVQLGYRFVWDLDLGARLVRETEAGCETIHMFVDNGLPYLYWSDFAHLRKQLSAAFRNQKRSCCAVASNESELMNMFVTPDDLHECEAEAKECVSPDSKACIGEQVAAAFLKLESITYDHVLEAVMKAGLKPQSKSRSCAVGLEGSEGIKSWVFGAYGHGPHCGVTTRTNQFPNLVALINRFMQQEMPTASWSSFTISQDVTFTPHKDTHNEPDSLNVLVVLNHKGQCKGGSLWIEQEDGDQMRQIKPDLNLRGVVMPVLRRPVQFSPTKWHGTTPWKGTRVALSFFTTRNVLTLPADEQRRLKELHFPTCEAVAAAAEHIAFPLSLNPADDQFPEDLEAKTTDATVGEGQFRENVSDEFQDGGLFGDVFQGLADPDGPPASSDMWPLDDDLAEYEPSLADPEDIFHASQFDDQPGEASSREFALPAAAPEAPKEPVKAKPGHTLDDYRARGTKKPHRKVQPSDVAKGVCSDLKMVPLSNLSSHCNADSGQMFSVEYVAVNWQKYHLLSYEEEQLANQVEEKLLEASTAPAQAETVDLKGFYKGDRQQQWKASLVKEYGKMKDVLEEATRDQLHGRLGLPTGTRLPREIPSKVVATLKPSEDPTLANEDGFAEKSRICACGNFESGADNNGEPWTSSNIPPEIVRTFVSLAASTENWTLGGLDVEAAFLNADISSGDPVIITPPKVMRDLGLVGAETVWIARKNIYGLRRGPTEWEKERDTKINHATIQGSKGDNHSALTFIPINLAAGLWKLVDEKGVVVGACCCYVDDGLVVGDVEVIRRVTAFIQSLWSIKGQGILEKPGVGLSGNLVVSETLTLKLVRCMRFLGAEIAVASDGLQIGQAKYVAQELRARGWLTLKGSESLPVPSEGLAASEIRDNAFEANMKLAQKEAGTLMWIALRSRPDIAACLGVASTLITSRPSESLRLCKGIWRYLRSTWDKVIQYNYGGPKGPDDAMNDPSVFRIVSDASLAPGGARSRSGVALFLGSHLLYWRSQRQALVAWSATESELEAMAIAFQDGLKLHAVIAELSGRAPRILAFGDNSGAIQLVTKERFHEQTMRTRHFAIRCAYIRDLVWLHDIEVLHRGTNELEADGLTKVLGKAKLAVARVQLRIM